LHKRYRKDEEMDEKYMK